MAKIIYTHTDEAPLLATYSLLPIVQAYAARAGVEVETRDISVAARILSAFGLADDALGELGELAKTPSSCVPRGSHRTTASAPCSAPPPTCPRATRSGPGTTRSRAPR